MADVHVVGAGIAGLSAAIRLSAAGIRVHLWEAASQAGGRCRSYWDTVLGCEIDNGNHLMLSGNDAVNAYLREIGADDSLTGPEYASFPFLDLGTGTRWEVRPGTGAIPWWLLDPRRRIPGSRFADMLSALRLFSAGPDATVSDCLRRRTPLFTRFWEPLTVAVLNTPPETASARALRRVLQETFAAGEARCRPRIARLGLSRSLVQPALDVLAYRGASIRYGMRLRQVERDGQQAVALRFGSSRIPLESGDSVLLAVPPQTVAALLPGIPHPKDSHAIVNGHFRLDRSPTQSWEGPILGLVGGVAQWLFVRGPIVSVTVSAADTLANQPAEAIAERLWADAARALGCEAAPLPPARIVKERRATFAQTPSAMRQRPGARSSLANVFVAGDWTDTGLPATIESAVRSGHAAARLLLERAKSRIPAAAPSFSAHAPH